MMNEFEKQIHAMFDHIWDCDINHPVFDDTVGDLMNAVIQCYEQLPHSQPEIIRCKDCREFRRWIDTDITFCDLTESEMDALDFCSRAERRQDE